MQRRMNKFGALLFAGMLALAGCQGEKGANGTDGTDGTNGTNGTNGTDGTNGQDGQDGMSAVGGELKLVIDGVATANGTATLTFTVYPAAAVCPGGTCNDTLSNLTQKTFYATEYDSATKTFGGANADRSFSFGGIHFKGITADGKGAQYTATKASATFAPESSASAMVYGYIADALVLPSKGSYRFPDNVASASKVYGSIAYASAANVTGCENCHVAPYSKHGYRQAAVAGLPDFASCKACHYDARNGGHQAWQLLVDDPAAYAAQNGEPTADQKTKFAYKASVMNDTHMSHAMEFAYPQSIANCVTCHEGKLDVVLSDANFTLKTCKSCHPVTGPTSGTDPKRAPALKTVVPHTSMDLYTYTGDCSSCHKAGNGMSAPTFAQIHSGRTATVYAADGSKYAAAIKATVDSATFDSATNILTVSFSVSGAGAAAIVKPTVVMSLYGYDSKDFVVGGHASQPDGKRNLEWAEGGSKNSPRLTVSPATATAGTTSWTATADLSVWAGLISGDVVKRLEIGVLPALGIDQTVAPDNSATIKDASNNDVPNPAYNPYLAITGVSKTFDLADNALVADAEAYGRKIVDAAKCNKCHEALGTTFHSPAYGSAGVVGCRLCHVVGSGGGHLEMQSRSIDSYVHAIHSMQPFDIDEINFADPVAAMRYSHHVESTYPSFSILNCDSCHNAGTYDVPDQTKSLPSVLSASYDLDRNIGTIDSYVVGPASRACGSCHRAELINEDAAGDLAAFNQHTAMFGTLVVDGAGVLDSVTQQLMAQIGGPDFGGTPVAGAQVETCVVCHPDAGAEHQGAFNRWTDGL
jgi:OmcA/MtrC family decaheme c-type cytochrome